MKHQVPILPESMLGAVYAISGIIATIIAFYRLYRNRKLDAIPTVGEKGWFVPWWAGDKFKMSAKEVIQEGYEKYQSRAFKVANHHRWNVIVGGRQHIEELRKAPADTPSFLDAANDTMKLEYSMGPEIIHNPYHVDIIRARLTRNLGSLYHEMRDEIFVAFDEVLSLEDSGWKNVSAMNAIRQVACRVSNRAFVGLPLCRDTDWVNLNLKYASDIMETEKIFRRFPDFLAPIVARFVTGPRDSTKRGMRHLTPIIEERLRLMKEYGNDWAGKRNDFLFWLLEDAPEGPERTIKHWTARVLVLNFASIHSISISFCHALFFLAENPQHVQSLREEVDTIVEKEGWSKTSVAKMVRIDSFLKESQRLIRTGPLGMTRLAIRDFTFSDGTFIPKGTFVSVPILSVHLDDEHYDHAQMFDPFRFSDMHDKDGKKRVRRFVSTGPDFLSFGDGKHACPGRFFAASEMKTMLAYVVASYDVKLEDGMTPPEGSQHIDATTDPSIKLMFRRRAYGGVDSGKI